MKVSELWLREWVNPLIAGPQLAAQLTMAGLEVDGLHPVAGDFNRVVVAKVLRTEPHPQADKLTLCDVDAGAGVIVKVVCGASNVRTGLTVALAQTGAHLPGGLIIKESVIRGQPSSGMLCSGTELGLEDGSEGIMELPDDAIIGTDLRDYLTLDDHVFDIDLTPNRADCFSVLGVAREVAALNKLSLSVMPSVINPVKITDSLSITIQAKEACPQYCGRVIRGINPHAKTPLWMKERLRRSGVRSLHPVVDVTNYVMLELGQPMHAFDLSAIDGALHVRYAREGESLVLLDGQELTLNETVLVIADEHKPLALAGVMGGEASAVQPDSIDIFLESAFFNPLIVAGVARRYGLFSDSSQRFERGVDPTLQLKALERATELLLGIVGGQIGPVSMANQPELLPAKVSLLFNPAKVKQLTGIDVSDDQMMQILIDLGMTVEPQGDHWSVGVPSHRFDISLDVDLVEEITRLYGYDNIKAEPLIAAVQAGRVHSYEQLSSKMAMFLSHLGYHETISYSFVDPALQQEVYPDAQTMRLLNPISSELSEMRAGMWPGLLASMVYNAHRQQSAIQFFETGVVFDVHGDELQERHCIAGLLTGEHGHLNWSEPARTYDFYDMKGDLQSLFSVLDNTDVRFVAASHPALHPGQTARIVINGQEAGWLGVLHPELADSLDLTNEVMLFELSLKPFIHEQPVRYQQISKYPQIRRDLSLLVSENVSAAQIEGVVRDVVESSLLKAFDVFDVYTGESIPAGKKSLAIGLTLQDATRTLIDNEINAIISAILNKLDKDFGIILRE